MFLVVELVELTKFPFSKRMYVALKKVELAKGSNSSLFKNIYSVILVVELVELTKIPFSKNTRLCLHYDNDQRKGIP